MSGFANRTTPHPTTQTLLPNVLAALFLTGRLGIAGASEQCMDALRE